MTSVVNETEYKNDVDDILFIPTFHTHSYATSDDAQRLVCLPHQQLSENFKTVLGNRSFASISFTDKDYNRNVILPILTELTESADDSFLTMQGKISILFGRMLEHYPVIPSKKSKMDVLVNILTYIDDHYTEDLTLESLADRFGYNQYHFSKMFNTHVGCNLKNYINNLRIKQFVRTYNKDSGNITYLAYSVGFNSMPSFYRAFNEVYHCSPKEFF